MKQLSQVYYHHIPFITLVSIIVSTQSRACLYETLLK